MSDGASTDGIAGIDVALPGSPPRPTLRERVVPPLVAFAATRVLLVAIAVGLELDPLNGDVWAKWDSGHYMQIAAGGYQLHHCRPEELYPATEWCGNAGWFPAYPALLRAVTPGRSLRSPDGSLTRPGIAALERSGVVLSSLFHLAALLVLWMGLLGSGRVAGARACLALAAVFPGTVYDHLVYPISLVTLCLVAALVSLRDGRLLRAGIAGFLGAFAYPSGPVFAVVAGVWGLFGPGTFPQRVRRAAIPAALAAAGGAAVLLLHQVTLGVWNAYLLTQRHYGDRGPHFPLATLATRIQLLFHPSPDGLPGTIPHLETCFVAFLVMVVLVVTLRARDRTPTDLLLALYGGVFWMFPLVVGGETSLPRSEALLLPCAVLARHCPRPLLAFLLWGSLTFWVALAILFVRSRIS